MAAVPSGENGCDLKFEREAFPYGLDESHIAFLQS